MKKTSLLSANEADNKPAEKPAKKPKKAPIKFGAAALAKEMGTTPQKARQLLRKQAGGTLAKGGRYDFATEADMKAKAAELSALSTKKEVANEE